MNTQVNEFKKNLILEKSNDYFKKYGYTGTQIDKIAKELQIGVGTIYSLFGSKDGLFFCWLFSIMNKAYLEIKQEFEFQSDPILQCEIFVKYKLAYYEKNKTIFRDYMQNTFFLKDASRGKENPMKQVYKLISVSLEHLFKKENISNVFTKDCYHLAYVLDGLIDSYIECYTEENKNEDLVTKTHQVIRLFLNAVGMGEYEYEI